MVMLLMAVIVGTARCRRFSIPDQFRRSLRLDVRLLVVCRLPTPLSPDVDRRAEPRERCRLVRPPGVHLVEQQRYVVRDAQGPHIFESDLGPMAALRILLPEGL